MSATKYALIFAILLAQCARVGAEITRDVVFPPKDGRFYGLLLICPEWKSFVIPPDGKGLIETRGFTLPNEEPVKWRDAGQWANLSSVLRPPYAIRFTGRAYVARLDYRPPQDGQARLVVTSLKTNETYSAECEVLYNTASDVLALREYLAGSR